MNKPPPASSSTPPSSLGSQFGFSSSFLGHPLLHFVDKPHFSFLCRTVRHLHISSPSLPSSVTAETSKLNSRASSYRYITTSASSSLCCATLTSMLCTITQASLIPSTSYLSQCLLSLQIISNMDFRMPKHLSMSFLTTFCRAVYHLSCSLFCLCVCFEKIFHYG